jgi:hypothetical protein
MSFDQDEPEFDPSAEQVPLRQLTFTPYRPGKFILHFRVDDLRSGLHSEYKLPLVVFEH